MGILQEKWQPRGNKKMKVGIEAHGRTCSWRLLALSQGNIFFKRVSSKLYPFCKCISKNWIIKIWSDSDHLKIGLMIPKNPASDIANFDIHALVTITLAPLLSDDRFNFNARVNRGWAVHREFWQGPMDGWDEERGVPVCSGRVGKDGG